jgi:hypothetical protein
MASIIKTDNIQKVSDDSNIIKKCGSTTTVGSGAGNTITVDGATITIGRCGGTVALASGATQTGFGQASSSVEYCTTVKTSPFTATSGKGFLVNTAGGAVTVTLPSSPTVGNVVAIKDYGADAYNNNITIGRNGSNIEGKALDFEINRSSRAVSLLYADATKGWLVIDDGRKETIAEGGNFIAATGGTILTCGDFKTHVFTGDGEFLVTAAGNPCGATTLDYAVVAGGGAGSTGSHGGGGGAGGFRLSNGYSSPNVGPACLAAGSGLAAFQGSFPISIGAGGTFNAPTSLGDPGTPTVFHTFTGAGGGRGGNSSSPTYRGASGGSGGGGCSRGSPGAGTGNTPPTVPPQGNDGGGGNYAPPNYPTGGGGGAGAAGANSAGGDGGFVPDSYFGPTAPTYGTPGPTGSSRYFAGGGGGSKYATPGVGGTGGAGGGGTGQNPPAPGPGAPTPGTVNTGGGGAGGSSPRSSCAGNGGSGIVFIRYKFQ